MTKIDVFNITFHSFIEDFLIFKRTQLAEHLRHLNSDKKLQLPHRESL